ncbi:hypothetical protein CPB84DRAFT_1960841 [Gymnopilus junonius]|uniref:GRF-type domain-containing protein n=1 Tax=Gymnopilus junonius TaxID=109634 RepID=A0A9P5NUP4_GYMJU|nr:hypothetical protein CPB84DRAFT_1960841 [Gymnopilus junonius]
MTYRDTSGTLLSCTATDMDETVRCKHNLPARIFTSGSQHNPGRQFYKCAKDPGDPDRCKFFAWVDELESRTPSSSQTRMGQGNRLPPTPQSGKHSGSNLRPEPPSTPTPTQSLKRNFSAVENSDQPEGTPSTAQKRSRLELIQEALAETQQDTPSQAHPSSQTQSQPGPSTPARNVNPPFEDPFSEHGTGGAWPPKRLNDHKRIPRQAPARNPSYNDVDGCSQVTLSDDEGLTSESITKLAQRLQGLAEYVRKLERKKLAAEKSRDAKDSKIAYLQAEVTRLQAREKELEEVIAVFEGK